MKPAWLANVDWQHEIGAPGGPFRWGRLANDFVAEWLDVLAIRTTAAGGEDEIWTRDGVPPSWLEKLRRGAAAAFVRAVRGGLSWHGAAVAHDGEALLLLGDSGAGKSTVAHRLCEHHGAALLADDVAAVSSTGEGVVIEPTEPLVWLSPDDRVDADSASAPKGPRAVTAATEPTPLTMCVCLEFGDSKGIRARELTGVEAFERLLSATLRFIPSPDQWRRELDAIARISEQAALVEVMRGEATPRAATAEYVMTLWQRNGRL